MKKTDTPVCKVKTHVACTGQLVRRYEGVKKGDPTFWACLGCCAWLRRNRIKFREVAGKGDGG